MTARTLSPSAYLLRSGSLLTPAEAAHLLTREASGESLKQVPNKTPAGYVLTPRASLSLLELADHAERVRAVRDLLTFPPFLAFTA